MAEYKIAVLGDRDSVLSFRTLGLDVFPAAGPDEARPLLRRLAKEGGAVIYRTEELARDMGPDIARYRDDLTPAIILIPGKSGSLGIGLRSVTEAVERAVGADIL